MPDELLNLNDPQRLLPTVVQHLPNVNSNPPLANAIFNVISKAHRSQDPNHFTIPLLPSLTFVALKASDAVLLDAAHVIVTLTRSLVTRRLASHASAYLLELVALVRRLLERRTPGPVPFSLPTFPDISVSTLPPTAATVRAALVLLAVHIPSTHPLPFPLFAANGSLAIQGLPLAPAIRLWHSVGPRTRAAVLNLAARHELLSSLCGSSVGNIAVHLMHRAFDPTCAMPVPAPLRDRIISVATDAIPHVMDPAPLFLLIAASHSHRRISAHVWAHQALPHALRKGFVGNTVRSFSRAGRVDLFSTLPTVSEPSMSFDIRPRKRQRSSSSVDPMPSPSPPSQVDASQTNSLPLSGTSDVQDDGAFIVSTPASVLQRAFAALHSVQRCAETPSSVQMLANAATISADALVALSDSSSVLPQSARHSRDEWLSFAVSLARILRDLAHALPNHPAQSVWSAILTMGSACIRLDGALRLGLHEAAEPPLRVQEAYSALREVVAVVIPLTCTAIRSSVIQFPIKQAASLFHKLGNAVIDSPNSIVCHPSVGGPISDLSSYVLALPESWDITSKAALVKGVFHARLAVARIGDAALCPIPNSPACLVDLIINHLRDAPVFAAAGLYALADELCSSLRCCKSHTPHFYGASPVASVDELHNINDWGSALKIVAQAAHSHDYGLISSAAIRCLATMTAHCPSSFRDDHAQILVDVLWTATQAKSIPIVLASVSHLLSCERKDGKGGSRSDDTAKTESRPDEAGKFINNLLTTKLNSHVDGINSLFDVNVPSIDKLNELNARPIVYYLFLDFDSLNSTHISGIACHTLLLAYTSEVSAPSPASPDSQFDSHLPDVSGPPIMKFWGDIVAVAMMLYERIELRRDRKGTVQNDVNLLPSFSGTFRLPCSPAQAVANMFTSRGKDWLPIAFNLMLNNNDFSMLITKVTMEKDVRSLWSKVPRYVVTTLLVKKDVELLNMLAAKLGTSSRELVEKSVADSLAVVMMNQGTILEEDSVITHILGRPMFDIVRGKAGKVVQRLIMEFGGTQESKAKVALVKFAKILGTKAAEGNADSVSGTLVSSHFMLVMDAVNRRLFQSKTSESEQIRHLHMLMSVVYICKDHLHSFVPKILATLKLALDTFSDNDRVCVESLQLWSNFLNTLGSGRIISHVASILAIIIPFVSRLENTLCTTLSTLIEKSASQTYSDRSLVVLLLRIANRPTLTKTAEILEKSGSQNSERPASSPFNRPSDFGALMMDLNGIEKVCRDAGLIFAKHRNGTIEVLTAQYFLRILRANREKINEAGLSHNLLNEMQSNGKSMRVGALLRMLVEQLSMTKNLDCRRAIMQSIGEVGAIDPSFVSKSTADAKSASDRRNLSNLHTYPVNVQALVALLLDDYLVPTLARGELHRSSTSRLNRIGLVIQELLRVCGCNRNTAARASKTVGGRKREDGPVRWETVLDGETSDENAIYFWENLLSATKDVIEPYLSEPFDVQHYKGIFGGDAAGDERLVCQPIWPKIKAAASVGVVANAQEWRRQAVVQLVDFIGKQGTFGGVLRALRPILRYENNVTALIFPLVITTALDIQEDKKKPELKIFLIREIAAVLKEAASPEVIFDLFDVLRDWRERRSMVKAQECVDRVRAPNGSTSAGSKRKPNLQKFVELARAIDPLSNFVDLYQHVSPSLSLLLQARCAFHARSYARAILLAENHVRQKRIEKNIQIWPASLEIVLGKVSTNDSNEKEDVESYSILQKSFAELEDAESMRGVAALRASRSLEEVVIDTEVSGRFNEALITYERAIADNPRSVQFHKGFLRCLMTLGHWETMLSHAEGLVHSSKLSEMELRRNAEANGIEAAWRLGRWDNIEKFDSIPSEMPEVAENHESNSWDVDCTISFGKMLYALQAKNVDAFRQAANAAREHLISPMIRASVEGYNRAYPMIVRLHTIADVEDTLDGILNKVDPKVCGKWKDPDISCAEIHHIPRLVSLESRTSTASASLKVREPLLSTKRVCLEQLGMINQAACVNLELARVAKDGDNLRSAAASAFRALSMTCSDEEVKNASVIETAQIQRAQGDLTGALVVVKKEIDRLLLLMNHQKQVKVSSKILGVTSDHLCTAFVLAGSWIAESRSEPSEVVLHYFQQATCYGASREEPFYVLGKHYDSLLQASSNADEDLTLSGESSESRTARRSTPIETHTPEHSSRYVPLVIKSYARALSNGYSRIFEALPRMLTVWFDYYTGLDDGKDGWKSMNVEGRVKDVVKLAFESIPRYMWMTAIPQLMSRILHNRKVVREELFHILAHVMAQFPDEGYWTIAPSTHLRSSPERKKATSDILMQAIGVMKRDKRGNWRERAQAFRERVQYALMIMNCFVEICEAPGSKERRGRTEDCSKEFKKLRSMLITNTKPNPIVPHLRSLTVRLPTARRSEHRPFGSDPVRIIGIDNLVLVMSSLMCPRRITLIGSDGNQYRYLAKRESNGDMRRDSRVVEFLTVMNRLLSKEAASYGNDLQLLAYAVLPLSEETGMIEWVNDLCPLRTLVSNEHARLEKIPNQVTIKQKHDMLDRRSFLQWACENLPPKLDHFFVRQFGGGDARAWLTARNEWTRSSAVWSMSGYIVGIGDRHGENVLVETTTGRCVHVDFAMLFEKGRRLRVPEVVPFRLTQNMVVVMGIAGYEGIYRTVCEKVMRIVRRNNDALLSRLESFLYDPLADWAGSETHGSKAGVLATREAWQARATVKAKLTGMVDSSGLALSIEGQVERLIREATSADNLSRMYIWWGSWI